MFLSIQQEPREGSLEISELGFCLYLCGDHLKLLCNFIHMYSSPPPLGYCALTVLGFNMMEAAMTVNQLGKDLSSCLHSSCMILHHSSGPTAAGSTSPASWSKSKGSFLSSVAMTHKINCFLCGEVGGLLLGVVK